MLSSHVVDLARRAISGEFGKAIRNNDFSLDGDPSLQGLSGNRLYAEMVRQTAARAPIRLLPGLMIVGSAVLPQARQHRTPLKNLFGTDHTTPGFDRVLHLGYRGLRSEIRSRLARENLTPDGRELLESMLVCLDGASIWHQRYLGLLEKALEEAPLEFVGNYEKALQALRNVPENPPETFHEALQSLWFSFAFVRLFGNWPGLGRVDQMLWPYLEQDLLSGELTLSEARELLAHFWVMGVEWTDGDTPNPQIWDGMYYQNVVLGGVDSDGEEITNPVTYLVLDVVEALHICDFPVAVRLNHHSPDLLLERIVEVQRRGGGIVSVYNEPVVLDALCEEFGYQLHEARTFANDGCWEVLIPGRTNFQYRPHDMLLLLQKMLRIDTPQDKVPDYADFKSLYADFHQKLKEKVAAHHEDADTYGLGGMVAPLFSLFYEDCIENARGYHDRGCGYTALSLQFAGLPDTANALYAIKKIVYDQHWMDMPELIRALRENWEGYEVLRQRIRKELRFYGNGNPEVDNLVARIIHDFADLMSKDKVRHGSIRPWGISTFGGQVGMSSYRWAMPFGTYRGAILSSNLSPTPGTDEKGPTVVIGSYCRLPLSRLPIGTALDLKLHPSVIEGERGLTAWKAILRTFVELGGFYLQVDVVDSQVLRMAQKHPEQYPALTVRIGGWSARFAALSPEFQQMIIERTEHQGL